MAEDDPEGGLGRGALFAAGGLVAGALLCLLAPPFGIWIALAAGLAAALFGILSGGRNRKANEGAAAAAEPALPLPPEARDIVECVPDPIMLLDNDGRVLYANAGMQAVAGTDAERKHVSAVIRTPSLLQAIDFTSESGEPSTADFVERVPVERYYQAQVTRTATAPYITAVFLHDLTALKRAEQARADFIANASHELRTPLAAVSGFIDTLRGHARDDDSVREKFLEIMSVEAQRMRRLIEDLLSLTRIELNEHVPPAGEISLESVVRDAAAALAPLAQMEEISIVVDAAPGLPPVQGERDELIQVFQNLIQNGIKYGKPGGHVWITLSAAPDAPAYGRGGKAMVSAVVRDDGEGIPREAIPRLTERFYRVDIKRSRERGGTGLGLAIVKHILNRHHGRLTIESRVGEGSTFTILLPEAVAAEGESPAVVTELL
jgi:two-component system phosphate regulon sensor histidine kinase PhoR